MFGMRDAQADAMSTAHPAKRVLSSSNRDQKSVASHGPVADVFRRLASAASQHLGSPWAFMAAVAVVVAWAFSGPFFQFNETWQLVINTGTTIMTFLMVFLVQSTQNRDAKAIHLKLDELIRSSAARNVFADLEDATDEELDSFQREFEKLRKSGASVPEAVEEAKESLSDEDKA